MDFVRPITAAFDAPYTKRFAMPLMEPATEATLMMEPPPRLQHFRQEITDYDIVTAHIEIEGEIPILVGALQYGPVMHESGAVENYIWHAYFGSDSRDIAILQNVQLANFNPRGAFEFSELLLI